MKRIRTLGLVCARGGSKGIPNKNLQILGSRSLIGHAVVQAVQCPGVDRVLVSTDSHAIREIATASGGSAPFLRPEILSGDNVSEWTVWQHALRWFKHSFAYLPRYLLVVPPTSPFRAEADLVATLKKLTDGRGRIDAVVTMTPSARNPYFNMVEQAGNGLVRRVLRADSDVINRQSAPPTYDMTTVAFATHADFVLDAQNLWDGRVGGVCVPTLRALDIDEPVDLEFARFLVANGQELWP